MNVDQMIALAKELADCKGTSDARALVQSRYKGYGHGEGSYRSVFLIDDYAFKFVQQKRNVYMNRAEMDIYALAPDAIKEWLAKPLFITANSRVLVMERLTSMYNAPRGVSADVAANAIDSLSREIFPMHDKYGTVSAFSDMHYGNFGARNDRAVLLDYGMIGSLYATAERIEQDPAKSTEETCWRLLLRDMLKVA
jgi:hypothetical protein